MFAINAERLGTIGNTKKGGYLGKYLFVSPDGQKQVVKIHSNDPDKLPASGKITIQNDFFFAV